VSKEEQDLNEILQNYNIILQKMRIKEYEARRDTLDARVGLEKVKLKRMERYEQIDFSKGRIDKE